MKTKITIFLALFLISLSAFSIKPPDVVSEQIRKTISYPEKAVEMNLQGDVYLLFSINEQGELVFKAVYSTEEDLKQYVVMVLSSLRWIPGQIDPNHHFSMRFSFKLC